MSSQLDFIVKIAPSATADYRKTGLLASVTIAQACLESSYGTSELAKNACNLFGMKQTLSGKIWPGACYLKLTTEQDTAGNTYKVTAPFRKYDSYASSIADHTEYLTTAKNGTALRYKGLTDAKTPIAQATIIKNGGYATDTQYVAKLIAVITAYNLTQYDTKEVAAVATKVFIGVGHGGSDPGASKYVKEADANLTIALKLKSELERHGLTVGISRTKDENDPIEDEIKEANAFGPALAIDVHNNAGGGDGFEVLYQTAAAYTAKSKALATAIETQVKAAGQNSRGLKTKLNSAGGDYFGFLRSIACPSVIVEGFFVDNATDAAGYDSTAEQQSLATAYAKGILAYLGITYKAATASTTSSTRYTTSQLNVREGAGTNYTVKAVLPVNTAVVWSGKYTMVGTAKWVQITANGVTGWVNAQYLRT